MTTQTTTRPANAAPHEPKVAFDLEVGDDEPETGIEVEVESYRYLAIEPQDIGENGGAALRDRVTGQLYVIGGSELA